MHKKCVYVPKGQEEREKFNYGDYSSNVVERFVLPDSEYDDLWDSGVFDIINTSFGLLIGDYEEETIQYENIDECIKIVKARHPGDGGVFCSALSKAKTIGVPVELEF